MASSGPSQSSSKGSGSSSSGSSDAASARREAHREQLRKQRQAELRRQKLVRNGIIAGVVVVVVAIIVGIVLAVHLSSVRKEEKANAPLVAPAGLATDVDHYTLGAPADSGKPVVELYVDFMCPACGQFHQVNGKDLDELVDNQEITLELHTRTMLDHASTTGDYSTRAANAVACVAEEDPKLILPVHDLLFDNQPEEGSAGLTNAKLTELAKQGGASDDVASCIADKTYARWLNDVVEKNALEKTDGTPAVFIDGQPFQAWNQQGAFAQAARAAAGSTASDG